MKINKIIVGTSGFVKDYGINKSLGLSKKEIIRTLNQCKLNNLNQLDTAISYQHIEKKLGQVNLKKFIIYNKIPPLPKKCKNISQWLNFRINKSLKDLNIKYFEGVLVHNIDDLLTKRGDEIYKFLHNLKKKGFTKKIGISIYNFTDLLKIIKKYKFDIVQLPLNVFDRRLLFKNYLKKIKEKKIEIHVRSIFLQGLLLKENIIMPKYFEKNKTLKNWEQWCLKNKISNIQTCINFISSQKNIDKIVIGGNSISEIKQIKNFFIKATNKYPKEIYSNNLKLVDPRKWRTDDQVKITAIIQARINSSRFPNKVLQKINKKTMLEVIHERLKRSKLINDIVFAIPNSENEKNLKKFLKTKNFKYFTGSNENLLDRYYKCAKKNQTDIIIRITSDCPLVDAEIIDDMLIKFKKNKLDLITNNSPATFPDGLDVAIFNFKTLHFSWKNAKEKYEKEHVVPFMLKNINFKKMNIINSKDLSSMRWTVDIPEDLVVIKNIYKRFNNNFFSWKEAVKFVKKYPKDFELNKFMMRNEGSFKGSGQKLWKKAKKLIPGGTMLLSKNPDLFLPNMWPTYYSKSKGSKIWDLDKKKFLDMSLMGVGTNILGYNNYKVDQAVQSTVKKGNLTTLNSPEEVYLAEKLIKIHPWANMARFTRSGGEANAVAIRIARAASNKYKVAVCGYHGWHDWYLAANLINKKRLNSHLIKGLSPRGVPKNLSGSVLTFEYNNFDEFFKLIKKNPDIGVVKMEVSRNFPPKNYFLQKIRDLTKKKGIILIFDECTSGFRQCFGGLHKYYNVDPDMAIFGKSLGNGYAINAIIGKDKYMQYGDQTFISSTFWTERIGPTAALKTLEEMEKIKSWKIITNKGNYVRKKWLSMAKKYNLKINIFGLPALSGFEIVSKNFYKYKTLISQEMLKNSILASNMIYFSIAHSNKDIEKYFNSLEKVFKIISECEKGRSIDNLLDVPVVKNLFQRLN